MIKLKHISLALIVLASFSCKKENENLESSAAVTTENSSEKTSALLLEDFEGGTKTAYTAADVVLTSGT